jgi:hypothetical protein
VCSGIVENEIHVQIRDFLFTDKFAALAAETKTVSERIDTINSELLEFAAATADASTSSRQSTTARMRVLKVFGAVIATE